MNMPGDRKNPLWRSFGYAFSGIWTGIRKERNMKVHCMALVLVLIAGIVAKLTVVEWCICMIMCALVGACQYSRGGGSRSGDRGEEAFGKDRQRYGGRSGSDRCDCLGDCGVADFCSTCCYMDLITI